MLFEDDDYCDVCGDGIHEDDGDLVFSTADLTLCEECHEDCDVA